MTNGQIDWIEIPAHDLDVLPDFYGAVFGWKIQRDENFPGFVIYTDTSGNVGGGFYKEIKPAREGGLMVYITVEDIEQTLSKIETSGGATLKTKTLITEQIGWWASFRDPAGNEIRLYQRTSQ